MPGPNSGMSLRISATGYETLFYFAHLAPLICLWKAATTLGLEMINVVPGLSASSFDKESEILHTCVQDGRAWTGNIFAINRHNPGVDLPEEEVAVGLSDPERLIG